MGCTDAQKDKWISYKADIDRGVAKKKKRQMAGLMLEEGRV